MTARRLAVALAFLAAVVSAETRIDVGATWVSSRDLGYVASYPGARVEVEHQRGAFTLRGRVAAYDSAKLETGDGHGERVEILAGWHGNRVEILAGPAYRQQATSAWKKVGTPALAEVRFLDPRGAFTLGIGAEYLSDSDDAQTILSTELRARWRAVTALLRLEHVEYRTLFAEGDGERVEVGLLYRLAGSRRRGRGAGEGGAGATGRGRGGDLRAATLPRGCHGETGRDPGEHLALLAAIRSRRERLAARKAANPHTQALRIHVAAPVPVATSAPSRHPAQSPKRVSFLKSLANQAQAIRRIFSRKSAA